LGHLSLEKLLKAIFVKKFELTPPFNHDLVILAEKINLPLSEETITEFKIINDFNIQTRYPEYKNDFYKRCTEEFVNDEIKRIVRLREWIKNILVSLQ
jgi:HEPN domain-containing protein